MNYFETQRPKYSVGRIGGQYFVFDPAGRPVGTGYGGDRKAVATQRDALQAAADLAAKRVRRPCLCCHQEFDSAGIHNRLCKRCASRDDQGAMSITAQPTAKIRRAAQA